MLKAVLTYFLLLATYCGICLQAAPVLSVADTARQNRNQMLHHQPKQATAAANGQQVHVFADAGVQVLVPAGWQVNGTMFLNENKEKIAELSPGLIQPLEKISAAEFVRRFRNSGPDIEAKGVGYSFEEGGYDVLKCDSMKLASGMWYYVLAQTEFESKNGDWGIWYVHQYILEVDNGLFLISFYSYEPTAPRQLKQNMNSILSSLALTGR